MTLSTIGENLSDVQCSPSWATKRRPDRPTYGPRVAAIAQALGMELMPWQRQVADVALEVEPSTGLLVYRGVTLTVPRQSGKTSLLLSLMIQRAHMRARQQITYTAQTRNDARKKWEEDHLVLLDHSPFAGTYKTIKANGREQILWDNGSRHGLIATTKKSGHGNTLDLGVLDEAFSQPDARIEQSMSPAMITRPDPQLWVVSTEGDDTSLYLDTKIKAGRQFVEQGVDYGSCYFEWSARPDCDPGDESVWWSMMPALGHTISVEAIRAEYDKALAEDDLDGFYRAYLNVKRPRKAVGTAMPNWNSCADSTSTVCDPIAMAVDVAPDMISASIAVAGSRSDGRYHVEVIAYELGTGWVLERLTQLVERVKPVSLSICSSSPAGGLLSDLKNAGLELREVSTGDLAKATGSICQHIADGTARHLGQPPLDTAVSGALRRPWADGGALWHRMSSTVDISPLVAVTLALDGWLNRPETLGAWGAWG